MVRLIMLGGTGSGKGTQSQILSEKLQIPIISTGDLIRKGVKEKTELGNMVKSYFEKGELIPDPILIQFMKERLTQSDLKQGWILEGYPRTAFQAEELDFLLEELNQKIDWAIYLKVSEEIMMERSLKRSLNDDNPEALKTRIAMFFKSTFPILEYYEKKHHLLTITGEETLEIVNQEIMNKVN